MPTDSNVIKFNAANNRAEIVLYGDIGWDVTARDFSDELKRLGAVKSIDLRINSFGGDVFDGLAIYSRLVDHPAAVNVHIDGIAASAASVIAMAGDTIRMTEAGTIMIHDAWALGVGNASEMRKLADRLDAVSGQMAGIYERRTGAEMTQIRQWMADETEFGAAAAVKFGFATETFAGERMAARFDPDRHHFKRTPAAVLGENATKARRAITEMRMLSA